MQYLATDCQKCGFMNREAGIASVLDKDEYVSSSGERNNPACSLWDGSCMGAISIEGEQNESSD